MFQSRRFDPVIQRAILTRTDKRRPSSVARPLGAAVGLAALVAACSPTVEEPDLPELADENAPREVNVTAAFMNAQSGATALTFLPNADAASLGLIVGTPRDGGLDLYDADGALRRQHSGPRLTGLAAAPGFQLRGEALPLIFSASAENDTVQGYAVVADDFRILDLPLAEIQPADGISGLCLYREGAGFVDLAILGDGPTAEIWRVRDSGGATLDVESRLQFSLPAPARSCVADNGDLYVTSPSGGIARIDGEGNLLLERSMVAADIAVGLINGASLVLVSDASGETLQAFTAADFEPYAEIRVVDGLSTPGISEPGAIAITDQSYGFTAYSNGMIAAYDRGDGRIKVISRESFSRALLPTE